MLEGLRRLRLAAGLTQWQLACATGLSYAAVRKWERGKRQPRQASLVRLAEALGVSLEVLQGPAEELHARRAREVGLDPDAPPEVVRDLREERGL